VAVFHNLQVGDEGLGNDARKVLVVPKGVAQVCASKLYSEVAGLPDGLEPVAQRRQVCTWEKRQGKKRQGKAAAAQAVELLQWMAMEYSFPADLQLLNLSLT